MTIESNTLHPSGELQVTVEERGSMRAVFAPEMLRHTLLLILIFFINMYHVFSIVILLPGEQTLFQMTL